LITTYQYTSNILGVPTAETDDWYLKATDGIISEMGKGGKNCHHWFGISYWTERDGARLAEHLKQAFDSIEGARDRIWDYTPLSYFKQDYRVAIRECTFNDITEIDTFSELKELDETYRV
jgi:CTP:phosphocholine cytidylyltransferase-like protein